MTCDVIIPTYNNSKTIPLTLGALFSQQVPANWQMKAILSDDGSTDNTETIAKQVCQKSSWRYQIINSTHTGAAGARNRALHQSSADIVFFLGADIILKQHALRSHLQFHQQNPQNNQAALGFVMWDPRIIPTPLMEWMTHGGSQNNYDAILGKTLTNGKHFFYGSHISLKRRILKNNYFQEDYERYGWEDIDLGRRLVYQHNLQLNVLHFAIGHHYHSYSAKQIFARQRTVGHGFHLFQAKHPSVSINKANSFLHKLKYTTIQATGILSIVSLLIMALETKKSLPQLYKFAIDSHYWCGFHSSFPHKKHTFHIFFHNESTH